MRTLEDDLRAARASADAKTQEAISARENLVREQGLSAAAMERAALSERQLAIAQDRLGGTMDSLDGLVCLPSFLPLSSPLSHFLLNYTFYHTKTIRNIPRCQCD